MPALIGTLYREATVLLHIAYTELQVFAGQSGCRCWCPLETRNCKWAAMKQACMVGVADGAPRQTSCFASYKETATIQWIASECRANLGL